jgi:hypothetical protein
MDPLAEQERMQHARIVKFQKLWRSKRVFSNSQGSWKVSPSTLTAKIVTFKLPTNFLSVFQSAPKGFSEVAGYTASFKKPAIRWVTGQGWIGDATDVTKLIAKRGQQTIVFTEKYFDVMGLGNYEEALLAIVKNGWAPKLLLGAPPTYKKIDGIFYVNKPFVLEDLKDELTKLPATMRESVRYTPEASVPAVVLKLKNPKWTYQFFKNGTVLFTGIKDPSEREAPKQLFKEFFAKYDVVPFLAFNMGTSPAIKKPTKGGNAKNKKAKLANRYPLASSWNAKPPHGFYVRPGTNGKPRLYKWRKMEKELQSGETVNRGPMGLSKKNAVMVAKSYANVGVNVPAHTRKIFRNLGIPIEEAPERQATPAAPKNRRAPSWNATKEGFYVRPGPGKQPYWFAIPAGLASGRKTVIKTYTDAGRNIPAAVRAIFKIPANVKTNVVTFGNEAFKPGLQHLVTMGLNKILRINNRQATRLTKAELLGVARNMGIAEANAKMTPTNLVGLIQNKAGAYKPVRNANLVVNGMYYRLLNNGRVEKTTSQGIQTRRAWVTLPADEQNKIAKALLPSNLHPEFNATAKANKFNTLRAYVAGKKPVPAKAPSPPRKATPSPSSAGSNNNKEALEFEYAARLGSNLGNMSRAGNEGLFMKIYGKLPVGARGKPLKANINRAYKKFVKETTANRANEAPKARYTGRIQVPNWMPANKVQAYKNLVTRLAFQKPKPAQKNIKEAIRGWINREVPMSPARAAREVENAITGEKRIIPAYVPKPRKTPNIPKRTPPAKKSPKPKKYNASKSPRLQKEYALPKNRTAIKNLNNAIANLGLPTGVKNTYTWSGLARAGLNTKFRNNWLKYVAVN